MGFADWSGLVGALAARAAKVAPRRSLNCMFRKRRLGSFVKRVRADVLIVIVSCVGLAMLFREVMLEWNC